MKASKILITIISIFILSNVLYATLQSTSISTNGKCFTPSGDLKVLFIAVRFGENVDTTIKIDPSLWDAYKSYPENIYGNKIFYSDYNMFNLSVDSARDINNISQWYYVMSDGNFRLIVDTISVIIDTMPPTEIVINSNVFGNSTHQIYNKIVFDTLANWHADPKHPFDWGNYDNRCYPNYVQDCSNNDYNFPIDSIIDYVVVCYRWSPITGNPPTAVADVSNWSDITSNYKVQTNCGFTQFRGDRSIFGLFIHEVSHTLYGCPHYACANDVVGNYFYGQVGGWGAVKLSEVSQGNTPFMTANAWERWFLGWIEMK